MTHWLIHSLPFRRFVAFTGTYIVLNLGHYFFQQVFAVTNNLSVRRRTRHAQPIAEWPSVVIVVPVYKENPDMLYDCLRSAVDQDYPKLGVYAVDDGSPNRADCQPVYAAFPTLTPVMLERNVGKRNAQKAVFDVTNADIYVTVDSDTVLTPGSLRELVAPMVRSPQLGAVTGDVRALNSRQNLLTHLIGLRYWQAFHIERAAQSLFGVVACCSGPYTAYRGSLIQQVKDSYVTETFMGTRCTFGDDRHLTNLILQAGADVEFHPGAIAHTHVPDNIPTYLRQQTRWSKSSIRETIWTFRHVRGRHPYLYIDNLLQALLPFFLLAILATVGYRAATGDWTIVLAYLLVIFLMGLLRSLYGTITTRRITFLAFAIYGYFNMALLVPCRLWALLTLSRTHWGTRK